MRSSHPRSWALKLWDPQQFSRPGAAFSAINAWGHKVAPAPLPQGQELSLNSARQLGHLLRGTRDSFCQRGILEPFRMRGLGDARDGERTPKTEGGPGGLKVCLRQFPPWLRLNPDLRARS